MMMNDEVVKTQETAATEVVAEVNPAPAEKRAGGFNREGREGRAATVMTDVPAAKDLSTKTRDTTRTTVSSKRPFP